MLDDSGAHQVRGKLITCTGRLSRLVIRIFHINHIDILDDKARKCVGYSVNSSAVLSFFFKFTELATIVYDINTKSSVSVGTEPFVISDF